MATSKGVMQGDTAVAVVDAKAPIIVAAAAHGTGSAHELLGPMVVATDGVRADTTLLTADAGYHREANLRARATRGIDALIADGDRRRRDARFATPALHHATKDPRHDTSAPDARPHRVPPSDFQYDPVARTCGCPAGRSRYRKGRNHVTHGRLGEHYQGAKRDCVPCALRARCVRPPEKTAVRQVAFFRHQVADRPTRHPWTAAMRARIDTPAERARDAQRFATVEPVCANRRHHTRLDRFTLRREAKVTAQWTRFCLVHHIEKLAHHGRAA